jgi:hypothetical protein
VSQRHSQRQSFYRQTDLRGNKRSNKIRKNKMEQFEPKIISFLCDWSEFREARLKIHSSHRRSISIAGVCNQFSNVNLT